MIIIATVFTLSLGTQARTTVEYEYEEGEYITMAH